LLSGKQCRPPNGNLWFFSRHFCMERPTDTLIVVWPPNERLDITICISSWAILLLRFLCDNRWIDHPTHPLVYYWPVQSYPSNHPDFPQLSTLKLTQHHEVKCHFHARDLIGNIVHRTGVTLVSNWCSTLDCKMTGIWSGSTTSPSMTLGVVSAQSANSLTYNTTATSTPHPEGTLGGWTPR
jgi:hypothetical protein